MSLAAVNDFVVKFANVNGSGSASANGMFAKSILRMGVPVAARNIFPSNIQGLPTWYEVRISEAGHLGRRGGVDLMVAMNPQTWDQDVASIEPGGYLFYNSTKPLPPSTRHADIEIIGIPLTAICNAAYTDPRQRQLFKNIIYVGALAHLIGIEDEVLETLVREEFGSKANLIDANLKALAMGRAAAAERYEPIGLRMRRADKVGERIYVEGNTAAALGAVYGGATVCAWYPITPSTSLAEAFTAHCQKLRVDPKTGEAKFAIIQGEDEIASIGIVVGAGWNGARAFTCTSGPGISLMQGVHRALLFRGDPGGDLRRAARRALHRHADPHPAVRHPAGRLRLATATPSIRCCSRRIRPNASSSARWPSTSPTGCRPPSSSCSTSTSA